MRAWLPVVLLLLGGTACTSSTARPAATTTTILPSTTTEAVQPTSTTDASWKPPAVIDLPYVQRVLETIYHLEGEATRHAYAKKVVDAELDQRLEAILGDPALSEARKFLRESVANGFAMFANPPGDAEVRALELVQTKPDCIIVRAALDFGRQFNGNRPPPPQAIIQVERADVLPLNPTGWGVVAAGDPSPGSNLQVCK